jgi:hypothetical protein
MTDVRGQILECGNRKIEKTEGGCLNMIEGRWQRSVIRRQTFDCGLITD